MQAVRRAQAAADLPREEAHARHEQKEMPHEKDCDLLRFTRSKCDEWKKDAKTKAEQVRRKHETENETEGEG